jgi:hypothetical protein
VNFFHPLPVIPAKLKQVYDNFPEVLAVLPRRQYRGIHRPFLLPVLFEMSAGEFQLFLSDEPEYERESINILLIVAESETTGNIRLCRNRHEREFTPEP